MSNKKLDALKSLFKKERENKEKGGKGNFARSDMYPFWNMDYGKKAIVRILRDKNPDNPFQFFVDKLEHTLTINDKAEKVPCLRMYGEKCPICDLSRDFYKVEGKESVNGKYYYRKKNSLVHLLVVDDPLPADEETGETYEGKTSKSQFSYQLMEKIKKEISSDEMDSDPFDLIEGYNFVIEKTKQGEYGNYTVGSGFARRPSAVAEELRETIELIDLETMLPKNPGYEYVKSKLDAHLHGTDDPDSGDGDDDSDDADATVEEKTVTKTETKTKAKEETKVSEAAIEEDMNDVLASIRRNRGKKD